MKTKLEGGIEVTIIKGLMKNKKGIWIDNVLGPTKTGASFTFALIIVEHRPMTFFFSDFCIGEYKEVEEAW